MNVFIEGQSFQGSTDQGRVQLGRYLRFPAFAHSAVWPATYSIHAGVRAKSELYVVWTKGRYRPSINWACKMSKSALENSSVPFRWWTSEWVSCRFIGKRLIIRLIPRRSHQNSVVETRLARYKNSIINFSRSEFPADFWTKETCEKRRSGKLSVGNWVDRRTVTTLTPSTQSNLFSKLIYFF